ncbi:MAG: hypothetical protein M5U19_21515 [Microthrixaceae bacterium]|nr:hypothetical protein [Microthrixaceae bacterium]
MTDWDRGRAETSEDTSAESVTGSTPELLYEVSEGVATITINRPERRNALSWDVLTAMRRRSRMRDRTTPCGCW